MGVMKAQNQRIVVLECFTSATCGPCANYNPQLDNLINNNQDKLIAIKYHVNWPSDHDPMNHHNPSDVSSKVSYYSVNSVPMSIGDGTWKGNSGNVTQSLIDQWAAVESPIEMRTTFFFNATQDTMFVVAMGRALTDVNSNNLRLNVSILEKTMEYATAPGTNGERIFHNVMKKMLPKPSGQILPALHAGDYFAYTYSWALANVMNIDELTAVAWVQDSNTKEMFQGCKTTENFNPYYAKQARIAEVFYMKDYICTGSITPSIIVENLGQEAINTLKINTLNNGIEIASMNWEGNIPFGRSSRIALGEINFDVQDSDNISFEIELINGLPDDYATPTLTYQSQAATTVYSNKTLKLYIRTSTEPELMTWNIVNANTGAVVSNGGPYDEAHKIYQYDLDLDTDGCYVVTMNDAGNNGLGTGDAKFSLKSGNATIFTCEGFTDTQSCEFYYSTDDAVIENAENNAQIYPNPSTGLITVETESFGNATVYNTAGQLVYSQKIDGKTVLNLSNLEKGTYLFVLTSENGESKQQIIVLQ